MRLFVVADGDWSELTDGDDPAVRIVAPDLAHARRARTRIREGCDDSENVAVILDVTVAVAADFRSAQAALDPVDGVSYAGTVDGLAGLIADIETAGVADGVTLIPVPARPDVRSIALDVLDWLAVRGHPRAS